MDDYNLKITLLSKFLNLLIITNLTLFVASGLVFNFQYYFPIISLVIFLVMVLIIIFPLTNLKSKKIYWTLFLLLFVGSYFLIASILYMIKQGDFQKLT